MAAPVITRKVVTMEENETMIAGILLGERNGEDIS